MYAARNSSQLALQPVIGYTLLHHIHHTYQLLFALRSGRTSRTNSGQQQNTDGAYFTVLPQQSKCTESL
eukprot:6183587-Pleurochrysis_carterae.AAC.3